jgi:hypothetical protein
MTTAEGWMPGTGLGQRACSILEQSLARATEGFATKRRTWPGAGVPTKSAGTRTTEAWVEATAVLYFRLPRNVRSPFWAEAREAIPVIVSPVDPSVLDGWVMAVTSARVNETCMARKTKNPACSTQAGFVLKLEAL